MKQIILSIVLLMTAVVTASAHKVTINVNGVDNEEGQIGIVVFDEQHYMDYSHPAWATLTVPVKGKTTVTCDLPSGQYAVMVMHDENNNVKVDTDANGIPTEPTGMSNNPVLKGYPTFKQLAVNVKGNKTINIDLVRYKK